MKTQKKQPEPEAKPGPAGRARPAERTDQTMAPVDSAVCVRTRTGRPPQWHLSGIEATGPVPAGLTAWNARPPIPSGRRSLSATGASWSSRRRSGLAQGNRRL